MKSSSAKILSFIKKFKANNDSILEDLFLHGYCYYFSLMLNNRFGGNIYYLPVSCHFVCCINAKYYDITGEVEANEPRYLWDTYKYFDYSDYNRVVKYCINK